MAEALGIRSELVRVTVTECSVTVVLSGQILCRRGEKAFCSCKALAACDREVLEDPLCAYSLREECDAMDRIENAVEDERLRTKVLVRRPRRRRHAGSSVCCGAARRNRRSESRRATRQRSNEAYLRRGAVGFDRVLRPVRPGRVGVVSLVRGAVPQRRGR